MKKGFSLSEIMISLAIIGVISAITLPLIYSVGSDTNGYLYKKAFQLTETVVSDLINNTMLYPSGNFVSSNSTLFCFNFANELNTIGPVNCTSSSIGSYSPNFKTSNGMAWFGLENGSFSSNMTIDVDVDGANKSSNTQHNDILDITITPNAKVTALSSNEINYLQP